jgi:hypothetical protein
MNIYICVCVCVFQNLNILCIFWSTSFLVRFFSGSSPVHIFGVDQFDDYSGFDNIGHHNNSSTNFRLTLLWHNPLSSNSCTCHIHFFTLC